MQISQSILSIFFNIASPPTHSRTHVDTQMGFVVDAECVLESKNASQLRPVEITGLQGLGIPLDQVQSIKENQCRYDNSLQLRDRFVLWLLTKLDVASGYFFTVTSGFKTLGSGFFRTDISVQKYPKFILAQNARITQFLPLDKAMPCPALPMQLHMFLLARLFVHSFIHTARK